MQGLGCVCGNNGSLQCNFEAIHNYLIKKGMDSKIVTKEWTLNHFRHIVWKLASYERNLLNVPNNYKLNIYNVIS